MNLDVAEQYIHAFANSFGRSHLLLAYHAAFPLALTPDLLYRLWAYFQRDIQGDFLEIPWVAAPELLLSNLCREVGEELYEMDTTIRSALLRRLQADEKFGPQRIQQLSEFMLDYIQNQLHSHNPDVKDFAQSQRWTVLAYTQPNSAAREFALSFGRIVPNLVDPEHPDNWEVIRLASLVESFADPLIEANLEPLILYARGMASFVQGDLAEALVHLDQILEEGRVHVAGVDIPIPDQVRDALEESQLPLGPDYSHQNLRGKSFAAQQLVRANFSHSDLRSVDFTGASLIRANFKQAHMGLQRRWAVGLVACASILALLAGAAAILAGWIIGWQFNAEATPNFIIGLAVSAGTVIAGGVTVRRGVNWRGLSVSLATVGVMAIAALISLTLFSRQSQLVQLTGDLAISRLLAVLLGTAVSSFIVWVSHRLHRRRRSCLLLLASSSAIIGIIFGGWLGWRQGIPLDASVMVLILIAFLTVAGAISIVLASYADYPSALICVVIAGVFGMANIASSTEVRAGLLGVAGVILAWAAAIALTEAISLTWSEIEDTGLAIVWTTAIFLMAPLCLFPLVGLGKIEVFPLFRVQEDLIAIISIVILVAGFGFYLSRQALQQSSKGIVMPKFAIQLAAIAGTRFQDANLTNASFTQATLKSADFSNANLRLTRWSQAKQLDHATGDQNYLTRLLVRQRLEVGSEQAKNFDQMDLQGVDLRRAKLSDASFVGANLSGANLQGADLSRAKLIDTQLAGTDLSGAKLTGAYIQNWRITSDTSFRGVTCDYIFTRLPTPENPDSGRQPSDARGVFRPGEFIDLISNHL